MTQSPADGATSQRIRAALWGLACGEAVGLAAGHRAAAGGGGHAVVRSAGRPRHAGVAVSGPLSLRVGPAARLVLAVARSVAAGEGRVDPVLPAEAVAPLAQQKPGPLDPALWAIVAGLINRPGDLEWLVQDGITLVQAVATSAQAPPPGPAALAAAAAVAAAVSTAVEGDDPDTVLDLAGEAASVAVAPAGSAATGDEPAAAVAHALDTLRLTLAGRGPGVPPGGLGAILRSRWEPEPLPSRAIPFALVLATAAGDAQRAVLEAADHAAAAGAAPAVAAVAGSVAGALHPGTVPPPWVDTLAELAGELDGLVPELARLR